MRLVGYCLMPNHFHLVLWPLGDNDLGRWMQWLLTAHVHGYRKRYRGSGHVWQGRFKAFPIEQDEHLRILLRYVERNPLRAGLVARAEDWVWSSVRHGVQPPLLPWLDAGPVARHPELGLESTLNPPGRPLKQTPHEDGGGLFGEKEP